MNASKSRPIGWILVAALAAALTAGVAALTVNIAERKREGRQPYLRLVELNETTTDPKPWGIQWPHHYDQYLQTAGDDYYGGSSAMPKSKLEEDPWLRRLYAGYAFSLDYREARGHAYMLYDQTVTERVTKRQQSGACLHCHASIVPTYRRVGLEAMDEPADEKALAGSFNWPAVMKGFETLSTRPYDEVFEELRQTPDGTPEQAIPEEANPEAGIETTDEETTDEETTDEEATSENGAANEGAPAAHGLFASDAHPVSCVDCHDPETMAVRVTRPGFVVGIAALARSDEPTPHLPSIERWRNGPRDREYDPNRDASRREMRSFVCGQCHVEYYCADKMTLTFPWGNGLKAEQLEAFWEEQTFPDGDSFYDYEHGETGAKVFKVQHPEFELWSQGIHARSGVSCADCHMPYERVGAQKLSNHHVRSPMENIQAACQVCHPVPESDLRARVETIQSGTSAMMQRAATAMTAMLDAIGEAQAAGVDEAQKKSLDELQRKAMWRLDYISSENSRGFHASQEAMRILGESIDYSRQAEALANRIRAPAAPDVEPPEATVEGVTDREAGPPD